MSLLKQEIETHLSHKIVWFINKISHIYHIQEEDLMIIWRKQISNSEINLINERIGIEICHDTINLLTDESLKEEYLRSPSVNKNINNLSLILDKYICTSTRDQIITDYLPNLIAPGTKGVIRGNKFNTIVKDYINTLPLDNQFEIGFETHCRTIQFKTDETPDWYILDKTNNKLLIGMNQLDLWSGGQQLNRGMKYINMVCDENVKLVCIVCNNIVIKTKDKKFNLFNKGFKNDTICYLKGLWRIIQVYFNL